MQSQSQSQSQGPLAGLFDGYPECALPGTYDEMFDGDKARPAFQRVAQLLAKMTPDELARAQQLAETALLQQGVTFSVYGDARGTEKIFPFCLLPRLIAAADWSPLERGLQQRLRALGAFLDDIYGEQRILTAGVVPAEMILGAAGYRPTLRGIKPPGGVRIHISGVDLIRDPAGTWRVLEDNIRTPSGVSYVVENRLISKRLFPRVFDAARVHRVDHYPTRLAEALRSVSPLEQECNAVVLTPGPYNSAYFEHSFLARTMGLELVQAPDLIVDGDKVYCRTTRGPKRVHVIYRRTDESFLDPEVFRADSVLGVPGLMRAYAAGNVALANAPGNGVADDKAVYPFVPDMIEFYLGEQPILEQVQTYVCLFEEDRTYVLENLDQMVVKAVDEAGGYGMLMGPQASAAELAEFRARIIAEPRRYIAQNRIELSCCPTWIRENGNVEPRRVDLRPYILTSREGPWVLPGGLTRVALKAGSYVVNSSQGGGSKDTWVMKETHG
ncbi:MAG: circularly permuted type 2 ATP-grasp protein [Deltaproteobacteria bacterium]|nr:circularly permuted type 2 ATP-grasp protein [Deltaproteobacteria bacterium]